MFFTKPFALVLSIVAVNAAVAPAGMLHLHYLGIIKLTFKFIVEDRGIIDSITSDVDSVFTQATGVIGSGAKGVFETVTCTPIPPKSCLELIPFSAIGGHAYTVVTSDGGAAITLATGAAGEVTSFAGSQYTIATGDIGAAATGSSAPRTLSIPSSALLVGLLTVLTSAGVGALIAV